MLAEFEKQLSQTLDEIKSQGLYKTERMITSPQDAHIAVTGGKHVLNMCANNYLGLADHPELIKAAKKALDDHGFGMASVRFICGTQDIHKELEAALTEFLGTEDTILYPSAFDANGGLFETILTEKDAVISDELNHASIIDGIRLCKAQRFRYKHNDMADLEAKLKEASGARFKLIATDGCFSMDGTIADLKSIVDLAEKYGALTMIDDAHATGFLAESAAAEPTNIATSWAKSTLSPGTLGKALGRREWRIHQWTQTDCRPSAAAVPSVFIFQHRRATDRGGLPENAGNVDGIDRVARQTRGEHEIFSRSDHQGRAYH